MFIGTVFSFLLFAAGVSAIEDWNLFTSFQQKYAKKYVSLDELESRYEIFKQNIKKITEHNSKTNSTFKMAMNHFTDLTESEFAESFVGGFKRVNDDIEYNMRGSEIDASSDSSVFSSSSVFGIAFSSFSNTLKANACSKFAGTAGKVLPSAVDWTKAGKSTAVKDQGYCGSCWAFSATEAVESAWAIKKGQLLTLSEQQLVDCSKKYGNLGCNGGLMDNAFHYVMDNGLCSEVSYPYTSGKTGQGGTCQSTCIPSVFIMGCADSTPDNQITLKEAVTIGPVSIAIQANSNVFQFYSSGIITGPECGQNLDHGVLITGYGTGTAAENNVKYWTVRNSWSSSWGEAGYVRIERSEKTNDAGTCGIAMQPSFPIV